MTPSTEPDDGPGSEEVRSAMARIVASEPFNASPQLASFLRFVVEAVLRGESRRIKGYTIAVEALGRSQSFDPQSDSIVRVVAGRLRRSLEQYYSGAGASESVVINLPRGSYIPVFSRRAAAPVLAVVAAEPAKAPARASRGRIAALVWIPLIALGLATIGALGPLSFMARDDRPASVPASMNGAAQQAPIAVRPAPMIVIELFEAIGTPQGPAFAIGRLRSKLSDAMARFDALNIVTETTPDRTAAGAPDQSEYHFTGSVEYHGDGTTTLTFRIIDKADGTLVWSRVFPRLPSDGDPAVAEDRLAREVAPAVAAPFGIIWAHELATHITRDPRRACLIDTIGYWRSFDLALHERVRQCLERMLAADPTYAPGYTGLALVYLRDFYLDIERPGLPPALDRALRAAERAVELKPYSARAHEALFVVWFARGEVDQAVASAERALALNPYDTSAIADYGARLLSKGEIERGMALLSDAAAHTVTRPVWFDTYLFLGAYLGGDTAAALRHASIIASDTVPIGLVARALAANLAGERGQAKQLLERLVALVPGWRTDPRRQLAKYFPSVAIQDRLLRDLDALGLRAMD